MTKSLFFAAILLVPAAAHAQTAGCGSSPLSCQDLAAHDAAQYGVPQSMFLAQIQAESSFNPSVGCNSYGACGIAQFIPSTAAQFGIDPSDPVASLSAAAQYDAQLYQQSGSWSSAMTAYSGGLTAANPADYGPVFTAASAADGGVAGVTIGSGSPEPSATGGGSATVAITSVPQPLSQIFSFEWNEMVTNTQANVEGEVEAMQSMVASWLPFLYGLAGMALGLRWWLGDADINDAMRFVIRICIIVPMVAIGSPLYDQLILQPLIQWPGWWQSWVLQGIGGAGGGLQTPVSELDQIYNSVTSAGDAMAATASLWSPAHALGIFFTSTISDFVAFAGCAMMFLSKAGSTIGAFVVAVVGPIILPFAVFQTTRRMAFAWIGILGTFLLTMLATDILLALYQQNFTDLLNAMTITGTPDTDKPSVISLAMMVFVIGASVVVVAGAMAGIGGGVSVVRAGSAARWLSGEPVKDTIESGARAAGKAAL